MTRTLKRFEGRQPRPPMLGRIRLGYYDGRKPVQSDTFIFTAADRLYLDVIARDYGGEVTQYVPQGQTESQWRLVSKADAINVLLPYGSAELNLEQMLELWGRGGIKRRCDEETVEVFDVDEETGEITTEERPCICAAKGAKECSERSRLHVWLPQTGLGLWDLSTGSNVALYGLHDTLAFWQEAFGERLNRLPVRLTYEPRQIRYFDSKEKKRKTTTKRVVTMSLAAPINELTQAVNAANPLEAVLRLALPDGTRALPSTTSETERAHEGGSEPAERGSGSSPPQEKDTRSSASSATPLERARAVIEEAKESLGAREVNRRAREFVKDRAGLSFPPTSRWPETALKEFTKSLEDAIEGGKQLAMT